MKTVAIIPARGGSKRIPRKNIRIFAGKPIIAYSIEAARASGLFDRIIVSTDDEEIAAVAQNLGAEAPFLRPKEIADDFAGTNAVVKHCLQWLETNGFPAQYACCIYATAPFVQAAFLRKGFAKLIESGKAFAFSVTSFPFPVQRALKINSQGLVEPFYPENIFARSQDLEESFHDAGQFYWGRAEAFLTDIVTFSPASVPVILPRHLVQDIDTEEDWERAELMYKAWESAQ
ncbi:pseudaminic acid cytidylyltransferase [Geopsychrobacter electrodiphilus]|uniref:pseudaminic acid cytidylyltransferase n=1 Tax=Geopsychrobacter electrodiphilus TaxID=225196 RepID=UPI000365F25D|nr:pseudaminic acid cytidylyltransferase [Geopsychrobacter electrodiphilus]